ncbi:MAG: hypothetical protein ACXVB0_20650 [Mucilaginibacter sp.]
MIRSNCLGKILMSSGHHVVVVHGIAQLAFLSDGLLSPGNLVSMVFYLVPVSIYHYLPRNKAEQHDPGEKYLTITFFQNSYTRGIAIMVPRVCKNS